MNRIWKFWFLIYIVLCLSGFEVPYLPCITRGNRFKSCQITFDAFLLAKVKSSARICTQLLVFKFFRFDDVIDSATTPGVPKQSLLCQKRLGLNNKIPFCDNNHQRHFKLLQLLVLPLLSCRTAQLWQRYQNLDIVAI